MTELSAMCSQCGQKTLLTENAEAVGVECPDLDQRLGLALSPGIEIPMTMVPGAMEGAWEWLEAQPCPGCGAKGTLQRTRGL
jgi:hypothetical protein